MYVPPEPKPPVAGCVLPPKSVEPPKELPVFVFDCPKPRYVKTEESDQDLAGTSPSRSLR